PADAPVERELDVEVLTVDRHVPGQMRVTLIETTADDSAADDSAADDPVADGPDTGESAAEEGRDRRPTHRPSSWSARSHSSCS
ncbi:hypothetical protein DN545_35490, partial [Burkholderia multivorans]